MNIVYLVEWDMSIDSGVKRKIIEQVDLWESLGVKVEVIIISPNRWENNKTNWHIFTSLLSHTPDSFIKTYGNKLLSTFGIIKLLKQINPEIIYTRQAIWHPLLSYAFSNFKTVIELNTDDLNEIKLEGKIKRIIYLLGRKKILNLSNAFISVSNEIAKNYKPYNKEMITIANGFNLSKIKTFCDCVRIVKKNKRPQLVFCGSPNQAWHGVDKILSLATHLPQYDFHIIGAMIHSVPSNITCYGYLPKEKVYEIYTKMDIAISTLALHRKNMDEASPLKSREYAAFGLPMIIGYTDTDLHNKEFVLNIGNYEKNIEDNIKSIESFIEIWKKRSFDSVQISEIDSHKKEHARLDFFKHVLSHQS